MDLWSWDAEISYDMFKGEIVSRINNLRSHIGSEAHIKERELGIIDVTGMTWEEQDKFATQQIKEYEQLLNYLECDTNWTP